jgi:hypothetical protein
MEVLLEMLTSFTNLKQQHDGAHTLCTLAKKATAVSPIEVVPLPPTPQVCDVSCFVYLNVSLSTGVEVKNNWEHKPKHVIYVCHQYADQ